MKLEIVSRDGYAYVITPRNEEFVKRIKQVASARWDPLKRAWRIDPQYVNAARQIMADIFGESDVPAEGKRYDIRLTFSKEVSEVRSGVYFFGRCVAYAGSRDGGARPGDGVCYLKGECASGGSAKNWESRVREGAVVMLYNVPESLLDKEERQKGVTYEFIERTTASKADLEAEKARLMARIAEIDALLQAS